MPAGSLSAPPVMTPGPTALRISLNVSRLCAARRARISASAISGPRGHGWSSHGPQAARVLIEQLAGLERVGLVDPDDQDAVARFQRFAHVGSEILKPVERGIAIRCQDLRLLRRGGAVLAQKLERVLGQVGVWIGRDDGLIEDSARTVGPPNPQPPCVDVVEPSPDVLHSLSYDRLTVVARCKLAGQMQNAAVQTHVNGVAVDRVWMVRAAGQHRGPTGRNLRGSPSERGSRTSTPRADTASVHLLPERGAAGRYRAAGVNVYVWSLW